MFFDDRLLIKRATPPKAKMAAPQMPQKWFHQMQRKIQQEAPSISEVEAVNRVRAHWSGLDEKARQGIINTHKSEEDGDMKKTDWSELKEHHDKARNKDRGRKIANNTHVVKDGDDYAVKLHNTNVVTAHQNGDYTLHSGGWKTATTKQRINQHLPHGVSLSQHRGEWHVHDKHGNKHEYSDGMRVNGDGTPVQHTEHEEPKQIEAPKEETSRWTHQRRPLAGLGETKKPTALEKLGKLLKTELLMDAEQKPNLHPEHQRQMTEHEDPEIRQGLARHLNLHPDHQHKLSYDEHPDVREALARNPNLHPDHQRTLVGDSSGDVRQAIAENARLRPEYQKHLVMDKERAVREALAGQPNLHPEHQKTLAQDKDALVRQALSRNANLHPEAKKILESIGLEDDPQMGSPKKEEGDEKADLDTLLESLSEMNKSNTPLGILQKMKKEISMGNPYDKKKKEKKVPEHGVKMQVDATLDKPKLDHDVKTFASALKLPKIKKSALERLQELKKGRPSISQMERKWDSMPQSTKDGHLDIARKRLESGKTEGWEQHLVNAHKAKQSGDMAAHDSHMKEYHRASRKMIWPTQSRSIFDTKKSALLELQNLMKSAKASNIEHPSHPEHKEVAKKAHKYGYSGIFALVPHEHANEMIDRSREMGDSHGTMMGLALKQNRNAWDKALAEHKASKK